VASDDCCDRRAAAIEGDVHEIEAERQTKLLAREMCLRAGPRRRVAVFAGIGSDEGDCRATAAAPIKISVSPPTLCALLQPHACPTTIFVDEFDAGRFKAPPNHVEGGSSRFMNSSLQLTHRYYPNSRSFGEFLLAPVKETSGGSTLCGGNHGDRFAQIVDSINSVENRLTLKSIYFRHIYRF
jgi:hypothetical protein